MSFTFEPISIEKAIHTAITNKIADDIELAIEKAKVDVEERIRKSTAGIALSIMSRFSITQGKNELIITVRHDSETS